MRAALLVLLLAGCASAPPPPPVQCSPIRNDAGKIARSRTAVADFKRTNPCPSTGERRGACPGYVVDHVISLKCCGEDAASNMQWQTLAEGKAKDKWENKGC